MAIETLPVVLSVDIREGDVLANIQFTNSSSKVIYINLLTICMDDVFRNDIFSIYDENNRLISYSGKLVNRIMRADDFIEVKPGESVKSEITINKGYKLEKGHKYILQYLAHNPSYPGKQHLLGMMSNKVEVVY